MRLTGLCRALAPVFLIVAMTVAGVGMAKQPAPIKLDSATTTITIGYVNWTEAVAVTHLMQAILENRFHYDVDLKLVSVEEAFSGVANGELDAFLDVWLPKTHGNYWEEYGAKVDDLDAWYLGTATLGLAVPNYVDVHSISELKGKAEQFGGKIVGIQPGAGLMRVTRDKTMQVYELGGYELESGKTAALVKAVDTAIHNRQPIVFTAWKPHWLFTAYPVRYLEDPKNAYNQADHIHAIARKGLKDDAPQAYKLLDAFSLTTQQLGSLELTIANSRSAWGGVRRWLSGHQKVIAPWLAAASTERRDYLR